MADEQRRIELPFERVDFSDLPALQTTPARDGTPIAFRVWRENPPAPEPPLVAIAIHGSSATSASLHPLGKELSAAGIPVYAPDERGHAGRAAFPGSRATRARRRHSRATRRSLR